MVTWNDAVQYKAIHTVMTMMMNSLIKVCADNSSKMLWDSKLKQKVSWQLSRNTLKINQRWRLALCQVCLVTDRGHEMIDKACILRVIF